MAFQIRQNIVNSITQLKINDTESVNQIASVLVEATKVEGEITPQSGVSVHVCGEMSFSTRQDKGDREGILHTHPIP